jgi:hypothetical protein
LPLLAPGRKVKMHPVMLLRWIAVDANAASRLGSCRRQTEADAEALESLDRQKRISVRTYLGGSDR